MNIFGRTPLRQRLKDINKEATELDRYTDLKSLKGEAGDLLTTLIQLCNENEWSVEELIEANLKKIRKRKNQYKALGRKIQVAILGLAANPPTLGHIQVAKLVLDQSMLFDEVHLLPCFEHVYNKELVSPTHRLEMCRLAAAVDGRIKVLDYEITNKLRGETYNLAKRLIEDKKYSDTHSFSFIIGLDNANTFDKWVNYEELEKLVRFIVIPRTGEKPKKGVNWYLKPPHVYIEPDEPLMEISSTEVRKSLQNLYESPAGVQFNKFLEDKDRAFNWGLHPKVMKYILNNRLYESK
jgi:nicotinate-nucleotide adenylyltransferase